ncbi:MAG TPA: Ig-like domain-containing protein, partial [Nitrospirota bacterium]|nr:Ig-like domain-containing protein [Nitrospirota bacterium]
TMSRAAAATFSNICTDYGIAHINAKVVNSSGAEVVVADGWPCLARTGIIEGVPAGDGYTVRITGTVTGIPIPPWSGEKTGVSVTAGETTTAGVITMTYKGRDEEPPVITSHAPSDAADIPVTSMITAIFNEKMAASTINDSTFTLTLNNGATPVSGSVVYDAGTLTAIFRPSSILSYSTTYTATLATDIEDMAGNTMGSVYEWRFTTENQPSPGTIPDVPAGIIAASGNSQVKISWDAVPAATSYNIYWSDASGVTKTKGTKISGIINTSYTHTGLTNLSYYYYVVTSVNSDGESIASYEIASAPVSMDSNTPTGSITINDNADYTTSTDVNLLLLASSSIGISRMCISNTNTATCSSWEPYTSSKSWILTTGDGFKVVFVWFEESNGNKTSNFVDDITLDTTPPIPTGQHVFKGLRDPG